MVHYFYNFDYSDDCTDISVFSSSLDLDAVAYALADEY